MDLSFPEEATSFGEAASKSFGNLGGVALFRRAEQDPDVRKGVVLEALDSLGVVELMDELAHEYFLDCNDRSCDQLDLATLCSACALARAAGAVALPFPVVSLLCGTRLGQARRHLSLEEIKGTALIAHERPLVDHGGLFSSWLALDLSGEAFEARASARDLARTSRLGPFVAPLLLGSSVGEQRYRLAIFLLLNAWGILGVLQAELALTVEHVKTREQFGKPLADFQAVQFQLADGSVAVAGLEELCKYTTWKVAQGDGKAVEEISPKEPGSLLGDALALGIACQETALLVTRICHQLHGAIGFCDEHDLSVLTRYLQPALRLSGGLEVLSEALSASIEKEGFEGIFSLPASGSGPKLFFARESCQ
jgi:hypothetical protein